MVEEKRICMECGQTFKPSQMLKVGRKMYCKPCSEEILSEKENSSHHGINIVNQNIQNSGQQYSGREPVHRNHVVAVILSILFGWFGIDRFYVNHIGLGFLKLITFGGWGVWWIIDIILFSTRKVNYVIWDK